jgi:hypothetical protein
MTSWNKMDLPLKLAKEVRAKLKEIEIGKYNTEDGQIMWLEDHLYDINLLQFYSIVPKEIKEKMTSWNKMNLPLKLAKEVRAKLKKIEIEKYNIEDGQIMWLEDN